MAYFDAHLRYSDVLYYLNIAKKEVLKKILGRLGAAFPAAPSKNAHVAVCRARAYDFLRQMPFVVYVAFYLAFRAAIKNLKSILFRDVIYRYY